MAPLKEMRSFAAQSTSAEPISRTMQYRKITKPLLERQRRARINRCLDELKDILVVGLQNDGENVARLEKADILELTVRHLHKLTVEAQQQQVATTKPQRPIADEEKFRSGYSACVREISRVLASTPKMDVAVGSNLMVHLGHALNQMSSPAAQILVPVPIQCQPLNMTMRQSSPASSPAAYRPYTPPASPQSSEVSTSTGPVSPSRGSVWRPF